jgi:hypothetical protein
MGISSSLYVGPYVECTTQDIEVDAKMRSCTRDSCSMYEREVHDKSKKFCPQCGSPIDNVTYKTKQKNVQAHYLIEEIDQDLSLVQYDSFFSQRSKDGTDTWIANKKFCERRCWVNDSCATELTQEMMVKEVLLFCTEFEEALAVFHKKYGKDNVTVKWGLIYYYS